MAWIPHPHEVAGRKVRLGLLTPLAAGTGLLGIAAAVALFSLIALVTNLAYYHRLSLRYAEPHASPWATSPLTVLLVVFGALVSGLAIRYGNRSLRGHGIPEVMEAVLQRRSRIPWRAEVLACTMVELRCCGPKPAPRHDLGKRRRACARCRTVAET